jgi:hypothetical protein
MTKFKEISTILAELLDNKKFVTARSRTGKFPGKVCCLPETLIADAHDQCFRWAPG